MKHKLNMIIGWICYWIILILPLRYTWGFSIKLLPYAGYYANDPSHLETE